MPYWNFEHCPEINPLHKHYLSSSNNIIQVPPHGRSQMINEVDLRVLSWHTVVCQMGGCLEINGGHIENDILKMSALD